MKCDRHFDFNATILCGMLGFCCFCGFYFNLDNFKTIFSEILVRLCHYSSILRMSVVLLVIRGHVLKIISQPRMKSEQNMPKPKQTFIHYSAADTRSLSSISSCHFPPLPFVAKNEEEENDENNTFYVFFPQKGFHLRRLSSNDNLNSSLSFQWEAAVFREA